MEEIIIDCERLETSTTQGLIGLLAISLREQTNLSYQVKEWGFTDIPEDIITMIDDCDDCEYLDLIVQLSAMLLEEMQKEDKGDPEWGAIAELTNSYSSISTNNHRYAKRDRLILIAQCNCTV